MILNENIEFDSLKTLEDKLIDLLPDVILGMPVELIKNKDYIQIFVSGVGKDYIDDLDKYNFAINVYLNGDVDYLYPEDQEPARAHYDDEEVMDDEILEFIQTQGKIISDKLQEKDD